LTKSKQTKWFSIKLYGESFSVYLVSPDKLSATKRKDEETVGQYSNHAHKILLNENLIKNKYRLHQVFLHELIHAINDVMYEKNWTEHKVEHFSQMLVQSLGDMFSLPPLPKKKGSVECQKKERI